MLTHIYLPKSITVLKLWYFLFQNLSKCKFYVSCIFCHFFGLSKNAFFFNVSGARPYSRDNRWTSKFEDYELNCAIEGFDETFRTFFSNHKLSFSRAANPFLGSLFSHPRYGTRTLKKKKKKKKKKSGGSGRTIFFPSPPPSPPPSFSLPSIFPSLRLTSLNDINCGSKHYSVYTKFVGTSVICLYPGLLG